MDSCKILKVAGDAFVLRCKMKEPEGEISFPENTLFLVMEGTITWKDKTNLVTVREKEIVLIRKGMTLNYSRKLSEKTGDFDALSIRLSEKMISDFRQRYKISRRYANIRTSYVMRSYPTCEASMRVLKSLYPHFQANAVIAPNIQHTNIELALLNIQHCNEGLFNMIMDFYVVSQIDIVRYVVDNWEKINDLGELALNSGNSLSTLERKFKTETGESVRSWIQRRIMEKSKDLLMSGLPVEEVSSKLGYSSPNAFIRAFKTVEGLPPSKWRKTISSADALPDTPSPNYFLGRR